MLKLIFQGGYMAAKKSKLIKQVNAETECSGGIFEGVAIFVNGYTGLWIFLLNLLDKIIQ